MKTTLKILKITGYVIAGLVMLAVIGVCVATWWLTPARLSALINREASHYLKADVRVDNARFTFWSTFPHFSLQTDSIRIDSRSLQGISTAMRSELPADADFLAAAASLRGKIDVLALLAGRYRLHDVDIAGLRLNLVAYNDSVSNYDILPTDSITIKRVPYITADRIKITAPWSVRYFSAASQTRACARMQDASLTHMKGKGENYILRIPGRITLASDGLHVLNDFPFVFDGKVSLKFRPFSLKFTDYAVDLGNTRGRLNMDFSGGDKMQINNMTFRISPFSPTALLQYLPPGLIPAKWHNIADMATDMEVYASARLTSPYSLTSEYLPSIAVDFTIPGGDVTFTLDNGERQTLSHTAAQALFMFDGKRPEASVIDVMPFSIETDGARCDLAGRISSLTDNPLVSADIKADANLAKALRPSVELPGASLTGKLNCDTRVSFRIRESNTDNPLKDLYDINIEGTASSPRLAYASKRDSLRLAATDAKVRFKASMPTLAAMRFPVDAGLTADGLRITSPGIDLSAGKVSVKAMASPAAKTGKAAKRLPETPAENPRSDDSRTLRFARHTPEFITVNTPPALVETMRQINLNTRIKAASGLIKTASFPVANRFSNLDLSAGFDSVCLHSLGLRSQSSAMRVSGTVSNLRQFLGSKHPAIIKTRLNVALDTVNINQLARAYESGQVIRKGVASVSAPTEMPIAASDSVAMILPRNLEADIHLSARQTRYMNLRLHDLGTDISLRDGNADIKGLHIGSDFGEALMNLTYSTADMQRMGIHTDVEISDINIVNFFRNFHTLLLMMPQMKNLSGVIGAKVTGDIDIFPDMYVNVPSLQADITVHGDSLTLHQNKFIRRITRMMLIHTAKDIHIADMLVNASIHDNLIELYPFDLEFDRYSLNMVGTNNFDGKMYYHIGVLKSPVPFPFGINIIGAFRHPELHFGGATFKMNRGERVTSTIMERNTFNVVKEIKQYLKEFIEKAAESDSTDNSEYLYKVPDYRTMRRNIRLQTDK